jgi:hypothetical protein
MLITELPRDSSTHRYTTAPAEPPVQGVSPRENALVRGTERVAICGQKWRNATRRRDLTESICVFFDKFIHDLLEPHSSMLQRSHPGSERPNPLEST